MKTTFYEILLVPPEADEQLLQHAYEHTLSTLSKRLRAARQRGLDTLGLEDERVALEEAWRVVSDPARRARYDRFLQLAGERPAQEADELWARVSPALLEPTAHATLELVRLPTHLPVGDVPQRAGTIPAPAPPPPATSQPVRVKPVVAPKPAPAPTAAAPQPTPRPAAAPAPSNGPVRIPISSTKPAAAPAAPKPAPSDDLPTMIFELGFSGALIRRMRERKGLSLDDVASSTRIARRYLEAIEADEFSRLPAATFVRGYLRSLARLLEVDPERLSSGYLARMGR